MSYGIYLHIPFCHAKCRYCDFYSRGGSRCVPDAYLDSLVRELALRSPRRPDTLYFGGGTPSLLTPAQAARLVEAASPLPGAEITLEANPDAVTADSLRGFFAAGINRISFGVQSARDAQLTSMGRRHTAAQAAQAFAWARQAGFVNISGDIMLGLPGYTTAEFDETLALLRAGGATHVSAYLLKLEPGTYWGKHPPEALPDADACAAFYLYAVAQLEKAGYAQYEISNFAKPGFAGRHNLLYWNCCDYLGLGPAAHSCMDGKRFFWPDRLDAFTEGSLQPVPDGVCDGEDYLMLQLRLRSGLDLQKLKSDYGRVLDGRQLAFLRRCAAAGYAELEKDVVRLTPAGLIIQNSILAQLL